MYNERLRRVRIEEGQVAVMRALGTFTVAARDIDIRNFTRPLGQSITESIEEAGREWSMDGSPEVLARGRQRIGRTIVSLSGLRTTAAHH